MKKLVTIIILSSIASIFSYGFAQEKTFSVEFEVSDTTVGYDPQNENRYAFAIDTKGLKDFPNYQIQIEVDHQRTEIGSKFIGSPSMYVSSTIAGDQIFYTLVVKKGVDAIVPKEIVLTIKILDEKFKTNSNNSGTITTMKVKIEERKKLSGYRYLGYIGTNFDLVDGIKAKNLFFATNFFLPPVSSNKKAVGAYISLYGNRTNTRNDTLNDLIRPYKYVALSDTIRYFREKTDVERSSVSDNLGAVASPLIRLGKISMPDNDLRMYYAPTAEFIWRRTNVKYSYNEVPQHYDVFDVPTNIQPNSDTVFLPRSSNFSYNQFDVNLGFIGMMVCHENEAISIRLSISAGPQLSYIPIGMTTNTDLLSVSGIYKQTANFFFAGRLWVTEPVSGLTLQAEVTNTWNNAKPYFGVTLSKALEYKNLGKIFQPISSR